MVEVSCPGRKAHLEKAHETNDLVYRYNTFYVLYPLGICSETWLIYQAIQPAGAWRVQYEYMLKLILFIYIPGTSSRPLSTYLDEAHPAVGSYILYTHMMAQRRKMMRGKQPERSYGR